ncbi:MAG: hypothetical protein OER22_16210, partial [Gammaproteobacteria bacterium]|nr:hypothetical protein [Gammaproteobacteria bacterium]
MLTSETDDSAEPVLDKRRLQALGVLLPISLHALSFLPGRHPLGRAGDGMRFLRSRPYEPGHDNPRDIDKFSPADEYWVNEWEKEAQAVIRIYGDVSNSMNFEPHAAVRNLTLLQLTYSLWRASDRVRVVLFSSDETEEFVEPNLKSQLECLARALSAKPARPGKDAYDMLESVAMSARPVRDDLAFIVSDFCPVAMSDAGKSRQQWRDILRRLSFDVVPVLISFE